MTMKKKLSFQELAAVGSMLFGLFFGAGNLIFPAAMGQLSGRNVFLATLGLLITGVGLPLLGVAALGISRCNGLAQLSERVGKKYSMFFTCVLYLTIGPFFAIPRCATVPFEVGISPLLSEASPGPVPLALFSLVFFGVVLWFSLKPGKILTWIGKILNPIFLVCLGILLITALVSPMGSVGDIAPQSTYVHSAFFSGFLEGYNTMDALPAWPSASSSSTSSKTWEFSLRKPSPPTPSKPGSSDAASWGSSTWRWLWSAPRAADFTRWPPTAAKHS